MFGSPALAKRAGVLKGRSQFNVFPGSTQQLNGKVGAIMNISRRNLLGCVAAGYPVLQSVLIAQPTSDVKRYVRFRAQDRIGYGLLENEKVSELKGSIFRRPMKTGKMHALDEVELLAPCEPSKVMAVALNYASHLGDRPKPKNPELFFKAPSAVLKPGGSIVIPPGTNRCDYEGELVVVIGQKAKNVSVRQAREHIFGVTCGNDVSARDWQNNDIQWWRAKGSDTFAPLGPVIAKGLEYDDLLLTTRLNGETKQQQRTSDLFFSVYQLVSFASQFVTLFPGDVIYTGTPGETSAMKPGDVVEVEIEGIGVLKNRVA
jgi:2-keto-4-pentenoate hydratase/2-oxohepta-3-ene-1,7-dioic acid hydratase in catechol pathway